MCKAPSLSSKTRVPKLKNSKPEKVKPMRGNQFGAHPSIFHSFPFYLALLSLLSPCSLQLFLTPLYLQLALLFLSFCPTLPSSHLLTVQVLRESSVLSVLLLWNQVHRQESIPILRCPFLNPPYSDAVSKRIEHNLTGFVRFKWHSATTTSVFLQNILAFFHVA